MKQMKCHTSQQKHMGLGRIPCVGGFCDVICHMVDDARALHGNVTADSAKCYQTKSKSWKNYDCLVYIDSLLVPMSGRFLSKQTKIMALFN